MKGDLGTIKIALEYAQFKDYRVRDSVSDFLKCLDADLDDVGFESSAETKDAIDELERVIGEIESASIEEIPEIDAELEDDEETELDEKEDEEEGDDDDDELDVEEKNGDDIDEPSEEELELEDEYEVPESKVPVKE